MMRYIIASLVALCALGFAFPAAACPSPAGVLAIVHDAMPRRLPEGAVVLEVDFPAEARAQAAPVEARVRHVVQGAFAGRSVLVRVERRSSCHYPFSNGRSGLIVGHIRDLNGSMVLSPIYVARRNGFRLLR